MINNSSLRKWDRLAKKQLNQQFLNEIIHGMQCSPFEAKAILETVYKVYASYFETSGSLKLGQILFQVVSIENGASIHLENCKQINVTLTLDAGEEDLKIREKLVEELIILFDKYSPEAKKLKPGQVLWTALDKSTRGDSPNRKFIPVILSIITEEDIEELSKGKPVSRIAEKAIARIIYEAYEQGGILSTRDVSLLTLRSFSATSKRRIQYEKEHNCILPHTGALHDMGTTISHKKTIVQKVVFEKKDPADVARECNHTQQAVDNYLKDYNRVKTAYEYNKDISFIHPDKSAILSYKLICQKFDI